MSSPIVLDCDTGEDDAIAILLVCLSGEPLPLLVSSYGNASIEATTRNSAAVLQIAGSFGTRVIRGSSGPMAPHPHRPRGVSAGKFVGANGLCNVQLPAAESILCDAPEDDELPEILWKALCELGRVRYVATGPLTNLARLARFAGPSLWERVESLHVMGGALSVPGNTGPQDPWTRRPYAEFNFYCDPFAVECLIALGAPIRLVPWDVTADLTVSYDSLSALRSTIPMDRGHNRPTLFALDLMEHFFECFGLSSGRGFELSDPFTALCAMTGGSFSPARVSVVTSGIELGRLVKDPEGSEILVKDKVDPCEATNTILKRLGL